MILVQNHLLQLNGNNLKKTIIHRLLIYVVILITSNSVFAQTDSLEVHTIKGKEYYIHIVQKGESLYFIHKKYNIPLEVIKKENPSVADGLSIGKKLFVPLKKDAEMTVKTDGNFINHIVKKGETLYGISKMYKVSQNMIVIANQKEVSEGIGEGAILKIPVKNIKEDNFVIPVVSTSKYNTHNINKGETLYSLSRMYNTTVDSIKLINGGLTQGLKLGGIIYVPVKVSNTTSITSEMIVNTNVSLMGDKLEKLLRDTGVVEKKSEYSIGLMLPFYLDENDEMVENLNAFEEKGIYRKSKFAIEFYNGFVMALDSISTDSCKFKVYVYDTNGNDTLRTKKILLKPEMKELDLIVGPLYYNNFKRVVEFAQANNIPIVSPVKQSNKILLGNGYVFKVIPSKSTTIKQICSLVVDSFKTENLLVIEHEKGKEKSLADLYVKTYNNQILSSEDTTVYSSIKTLKIKTNIADVVSNLNLNKNNVIFVPTSNQTFITNLFNHLTTTLNKRDYKNCKITLIGLEEWMNYDNIDLEYFEQLNVHYCSTRNINYEDSITSDFIEDYIEKMETYPSENTFLGFDMAYYFGENLVDQGSLFSSESLKPSKGMSISLNFFKTGIESGYENTSSHILYFNDYRLNRIY
jgi:LysM repeat protein